MSILKIKNLNFSYKNKQILNDINLNLEENEYLAIIGSSGIGKSTLLNQIMNNKEEISFYKENIKLAYMQQKDLLFAHKTVLENIALPFLIAKEDKKNAYKKAIFLLKEFKMLEYKDYYTYQLSGGQRQKIALIRAIIQQADLYLLDEPFSALDSINKIFLHRILKHYIKNAIFITHDINDALSLANRILILANVNNKTSIVKEIKVNKNSKKEEILSYLLKFQKDIL